MKSRSVLLLILALVAVAASLGFALGKSDNRSASADVAGLQLDQQPVPQAPFPVNPNRFDPYKQCRFKVKWDGKYVPSIISVSGLDRTTEVVTNRDGTEPNIERRSPSLTSFAPIVIQRGRTHDTAFEDWANLVYSIGGPMDLAEFRKDIRIELYNEAGVIVMAWQVYRCWPSDYTPLAGLDANKVSVAIESITLQHEGWERDLAVVEPVQ